MIIGIIAAIPLTGQSKAPVVTLEACVETSQPEHCVLVNWSVNKFGGGNYTSFIWIKRTGGFWELVGPTNHQYSGSFIHCFEAIVDCSTGFEVVYSSSSSNPYLGVNSNIVELTKPCDCEGQR